MQAWELDRELGKCQDKLEAIEGLLFRLRILLSVPPSLDCVSQINDEGEQRNFFIREVFEISLANYCKACADIVEEIDEIVQSSRGKANV